MAWKCCGLCSSKYMPDRDAKETADFGHLSSSYHQFQDTRSLLCAKNGKDAGTLCFREPGRNLHQANSATLYANSRIACASCSCISNTVYPFVICNRSFTRLVSPGNFTALPELATVIKPETSSPCDSAPQSGARKGSSGAESSDCEATALGFNPG